MQGERGEEANRRKGQGRGRYCGPVKTVLWFTTMKEATAKDDYQRLKDELEAEVSWVGVDKVVVLGIGNTLRGDDGFGPEVASRVSRLKPDRVFDAGTVPEDFLGPVVKLRPVLVIIADAASFGGRPGELRLLRVDQLCGNCLGTHAPSLSLIEEFLKSECGARTLVLAAQPKAMAFGNALSPQMAAAIQAAADLLISALL